MFWITLFTKCDPLSLVNLEGRPQRGIISLNNYFATEIADACLHGKHSIHFENMSTIERQYLYPLHGVSSIKSIIKCSKGPSGFGWADSGIATPLPTL